MKSHIIFIIYIQVYNPKRIGRLGEKEESYLRERIKVCLNLENLNLKCTG